MYFAISITSLWSVTSHASPNLDGTRHLSMGRATRASTFGTNAFLNNAAAMGFIPQLTVEPLYQVQFDTNTHSIGLVVMDSLNNSRIALGLGYSFLYGRPRISFQPTTGGTELTTEYQRLTQTGHELALALSVNVVRGWLALGIKPKYQSLRLKYKNRAGDSFDSHSPYHAFGLDASMELSLRSWVQIAITGQNLAGARDPSWTGERTLQLPQLDLVASTLDPRQVSRISEYSRMLTHGIAVFPTQSPSFSINFDGTYDFTSFRNQNNFTRMTFGGGGEYVIHGIPLRFGGYWDSRGRGSEDDRGYLAGGIGYLRPAKAKTVGFDVGVGLSRQITGSDKATIFGVHFGIRIQPN